MRCFVDIPWDHFGETLGSIVVFALHFPYLLDVYQHKGASSTYLVSKVSTCSQNASLLVVCVGFT